MGAGASAGMGAVPGLWTCRGRGEEPGLCCARQRPGFRFGSAEAAVVSGAARCCATTPTPSLPKMHLGGRQMGSGLTLAAGNAGQLPVRRGHAGVPDMSHVGAPVPTKPAGARGRSSVHSSVLAGSRDMAVGFPWLQQHCSCRMPSRTFDCGFKI